MRHGCEADGDERIIAGEGESGGPAFITDKPSPLNASNKASRGVFSPENVGFLWSACIESYRRGRILRSLADVLDPTDMLVRVAEPICTAIMLRGSSLRYRLRVSTQTGGAILVSGD